MDRKTQQFLIEMVDTYDVEQLPRTSVPPPISGIYFLYKDDVVVYVGQSVDIFQRVYAQRRTKDFDSFTFQRMNANFLNLAEAAYILKFNPILNGVLPQQECFLSLAKLKQRLDWNMWKIKRYIREHGIQLRVRGTVTYCAVADFDEVLDVCQGGERDEQK